MKMLPILSLLLVLLPATAVSNTFKEAILEKTEAAQKEGKLVVGERQLFAPHFVSGVYKLNEYKPLWDKDSREELFNNFLTLAEDGLNPEEYRFPEIDKYLESEKNNSLDEKGRMELELLLGEGLIRALYNLAFGKVDPVKLDPDINFAKPLSKKGLGVLLQEHISEGKIDELFDLARPKHRLYKALREGLAYYRELKNAGGWKSIPKGKTLKPGESDERVIALRERLKVTGDYQGKASGSEPRLFDDALKEAVETFQKRHGLEVDGAVGPTTLATLNVSVDDRINQIRLNLERQRWYMHEVEGEFLVVDIAGFKVYWVKNGDVIWEEIVQVGKDYTSTPIFKDKIQYLDFNPTWTIPPGIINRSIKPKLKKDSGYLKKKGYDLLTMDGKPVDAESVDWSSVKGFPYIVRQPPGPDNALGLVKFMFPNPHFVFLHDTNHRELFDRTKRTFSSGCIRVNNPFDLAEMLLDGQGDWNRQKIDEVVDSGKTTRVNLDKQLRIIIAYITASVRDGKVIFKEDIYKRDPGVLKALDGKFRVRKQDL